MPKLYRQNHRTGTKVEQTITCQGTIFSALLQFQIMFIEKYTSSSLIITCKLRTEIGILFYYWLDNFITTS